MILDVMNDVNLSQLPDAEGGETFGFALMNCNVMAI